MLLGPYLECFETVNIVIIIEFLYSIVIQYTQPRTLLTGFGHDPDPGKPRPPDLWKILTPEPQKRRTRIIFGARRRVLNRDF